MTTNQLLDEYSKFEDEADPDWVPGDSEPSSDEISSEVDSEEEKTESQRMLNG